MARTRRVAILMGQDLGYCRQMLAGIQAYGQSRTDWALRDGPSDPRVIRAMAEWKPHGVIAHIFDRRVARALARLRVPVVNTTSTIEDCPFPLVEVDHEQVGRMAARYLADRGFRHFGFFGSAWTGFSRGRERGFAAELARRGFRPSCCHAEFLPRLSPRASWRELDRRILDWLRQLPKPAAILASNDLPAKELERGCRHLGIEVPSEIAVLGVDNDEIECHLAQPPLSSIELPAQRIGYDAAHLLHLLMSGRRPAATRRFLPPVRVLTRQSTDTLAVEDASTAKAVGYIRRHATAPIRVADVVRDAYISRRGLERRFRAVLGHSVLAEIRQSRVEAAKALLATTNLSMALVAEKTGFSNLSRFSSVFRQLTGGSPSAFRRQAQRVRA